MRGTLNGIVGLVSGLVGVALMTAALASAVFAQTPPRRQSQTQSAQSQTRSEQSQARSAQPQSQSEADADLSITARVTAESLRFEKVPNPRVEFTGRPERQTVWESERENLPQEVRPGVTYRNIGITLRITSVFADIDRIVAEALGEVPLSDDARPATTPQTPSDSTNPPAQSTPPTQSPTSAATHRRRAPARRGRVN